MSFQTIQGIPVQINLVANARTRGWTISGNKAIHDSCNAGTIDLMDYGFIDGKTYNITFFIESISNGYVQVFIGDTGGEQYTTAGFKQEQIIASGDIPKITVYSDANCAILPLTVQDIATDDALKQKNSIAYNNREKKWTDYRTYVPDCGASMFTNTYTLKGGRLYAHRHGSESRNNFAGVQYKSIIKLPFNQAASAIKSFKSISVQSNQLMVIEEGGITTSLGQVSELTDVDWLKDTLSDGVQSVEVYSREGVYAASFLRDANDDLINGAPLKGNYLVVELQTTVDGDQLELFTVQVVTTASKIGSR